MASVKGTNFLIAQEARDLSHGAIVILSGGPFDLMNPPEVRHRMDQIITDVNADPWVLASTQNKGLIYKLLDGQDGLHIHQARWRELCDSPALVQASPLVLIGHSNGGAAAVNVARSLEEKGKVVDLLFTADSVLTLDDNGDPYQVPLNVRTNLNSYSIPVFPIWWAAPFPFGKKNQRENGGARTGILNIGLPLPEPGALEHRNAFYDLAGGDLLDSGYQYPQVILESVLATVRGQTSEAVIASTKQELQRFADERSISIYFEEDGPHVDLGPDGGVVNVSDSSSAPNAVANLHMQMGSLEKLRLTTPSPYADDPNRSCSSLYIWGEVPRRIDQAAKQGRADLAKVQI